MKVIEEVISQFNIDGKCIDISTINKGNINSTYICTYMMNNGEIKKYIVQKINTTVFKEPYKLMKNIEGITKWIEKVSKETDVLISMGHSDATYEEAVAGIEKGVRHTTHLFNAMSALSHRSPGVTGAGLSDNKVSTELIADTFHVNKGLFALVYKLKGDKLCLITDCIRAGGMEDGDYTLGGQPVHKEGIKCLMPDGTIAGSVLKLNEAVKNLYENTDIEIYEAVNCASLNIATALGEDKEIGSLEEGKRADIIITDEKFNVEVTILNGEIRYSR